MPKFRVFQHAKSITIRVYEVEAEDKEEATDLIFEDDVFDNPLETFTEEKIEYPSDTWTEAYAIDEAGDIVI